MFPRVNFIVTNSWLPSAKIVEVYNGWGNVENRTKGSKNTLRGDKTSCHRFNANQARLKMGVIAYYLLHMLREFYLKGEGVKRSMEWLVRRIIKAAARVSYYSRRWGIHVASALPLAHHYRAVLGYGRELCTLGPHDVLSDWYHRKSKNLLLLVDFVRIEWDEVSFPMTCGMFLWQAGRK